MTLIEQAVTQIRKESRKNFYNLIQAEEELGSMLQSHRLYMMKDVTLNYLKKITGSHGNSYTIRQTGTFLSDLINELKIKYKIKE
jgi:hypothetical protein